MDFVLFMFGIFGVKTGMQIWLYSSVRVAKCWWEYISIGMTMLLVIEEKGKE